MSVPNQTRPIMRDVTVLTVQNQPPGSGSAPTAVDFLGVVETVEIRLRRESVDVTAASDIAVSSRPVRWGKGSVKISGFSGAVQSKFASIFAAGGHATLALTETATGDVYQLLCTCEDFSKSLGRDANRDTLTLQQEGVPFYGAAGATAVATSLE